MKKMIVVCSTLLALSFNAIAQTRGPRYNPPSGGGGSRSSGGGGGSSHSSGSSSSGSSGRGSHYNPPSSSGSSHSSGSSSSGSSGRGSNYNPPSSSGSSSSSSGSRYNPPSSSGSSSSSSSSGPRYNPPSSNGSVTSPGTRYNPPSSNGGPIRVGPRYNPPGHQLPGHIIVQRDYTHVPRVVNGVIRYPSARDYYLQVSRSHIYRRWVQEPVIFSYSNGYWNMGGYPYYVYRGYRYRYDPVEMCQYELVDGNDYTTVKVYSMACTTAYDSCAVDRDTMNRTIGLERYFCAEAVDKDLEAKPEEYSSLPVQMDDAKKAAIASYLEDMSDMDIFKDGGVGNCSVVKIGGIFSSGNEFGCKFIIQVGDDVFPEADESVCSDSSQAALVGCNVGNERENTGCILRQAIQQGYCI